MEHLEHTRKITINYTSMQGLKQIPLGIYFLALAGGWLGEQGNCTYSLPAFVLAVLLTYATGRYYDRMFGRVQPLPGQNTKLFLASIGIFIAVWTAAYLDFTLRLPVNLVGLVMAGILLAVFLQPAYRFRQHYLWMAGLIFLISLLPLLGISTGEKILQPPGAHFNLVIAVVLIAGGLFDHYLLMKALKPIPEADHG